MGASYSTILVPAAERAVVLTNIGNALDALGCQVVHREEPSTHEEGFNYPSNKAIFIGPANNSRWVELATCGEGLTDKQDVEDHISPLALSLSRSLSPVISYYSLDSGYVAGYRIFCEGQQKESRSMTWRSDARPTEPLLSLPTTQKPSLLGTILNIANFDYDTFMRGYASFEIATAALAERLGASVHLIDPLGIQDGDGAINIVRGKYKKVELPNWIAVYYEKTTT